MYNSRPRIFITIIRLFVEIFSFSRGAMNSTSITAKEQYEPLDKLGFDFFLRMVYMQNERGPRRKQIIDRAV